MKTRDASYGRKKRTIDRWSVMQAGSSSWTELSCLETIFSHVHNGDIYQTLVNCFVVRSQITKQAKWLCLTECSHGYRINLKSICPLPIMKFKRSLCILGHRAKFTSHNWLHGCRTSQLWAHCYQRASRIFSPSSHSWPTWLFTLFALSFIAATEGITTSPLYQHAWSNPLIVKRGLTSASLKRLQTTIKQIHCF